MDEYINEEELKKIRKIHGYVSSEESDDALNPQHDELYERYKPPPVEIDPEKHKIIEVDSFKEASRMTYAGVLKKALDLNLDETEPADDGQTSKTRKRRKKKKVKKEIPSNSDQKEIPMVAFSIATSDSGIVNDLQEATLPDDGQMSNKPKKRKKKKVATCIVGNLQETTLPVEVESQATLLFGPQEVTKKTKKRNRLKKKEDFENISTILLDLSVQLDCTDTNPQENACFMSSKIEDYLNTVDHLGIPLLNCTRCIASIIQRTAILYGHFFQDNRGKLIHCKQMQELFYDVETIILDAVTNGNYESDFHATQEPLQKLVYRGLHTVLMNQVAMFTRFGVLDHLSKFGNLVHMANYIHKKRSSVSPPTETQRLPTQNKGQNLLQLATIEDLTANRHELCDFGANYNSWRSFKDDYLNGPGVGHCEKTVRPTEKLKGLPTQNQAQLQTSIIEDLTFNRYNLYDFGSNLEEWKKFKEDFFNGPGVGQNFPPCNKKCSPVCPTGKLEELPTQNQRQLHTNLLRGPKMDYPHNWVVESGSAYILGIVLLIVFKKVAIGFLTWVILVIKYGDFIFLLLLFLYLCTYFVIKF